MQGTRKLLCVCGEEKGGAMFLFEGIYLLCPKGKNREPGLQAFWVNKTTGRRVPPCAYKFKIPGESSGFFIYKFFLNYFL